MKAYLKEIKFKSTDHTYLKDITQDINNAIKKAKVSIGFVFVNTKHTTLGIVVNEIAEPNLLNDILTHTLKAVPEDRRSTRAADKKAYPHPTVVVPIRDGKLDIGKYQQVAMFEFDGRDGTGKNPIRQRTVQVWICPADEIIEMD